MAKTDPTGPGEPVALDLSTEHIAILRRVLASCLEGVQDDLETPEEMRDAGRARQEADIYQRLLAGLAQGQLVVPDEAARQAVEAIATASDTENNYTEVVAEHAALHGLLARLEGRRD